MLLAGSSVLNGHKNALNYYLLLFIGINAIVSVNTVRIDVGCPDEITKADSAKQVDA